MRGRCVRFGAVSAPVNLVDPHIIEVSRLFSRGFVWDEGLVQSLTLYGKRKFLVHNNYKESPSILTDAHRSQVEMNPQHPVANIFHVVGNHVTFNCRGARKVCRRCRQEGRFRTQ